MNTLGIAIKITNNGSGDPKVINGGEWTRHVVDVRPVLDKVRGADSDNRQMVRFLSFTAQGCLLTVVRCIAGRQGDNVAAWIFIPTDIDISGKKVVWIMDSVEQTIMASKIEINELENLCKEKYPPCADGFSNSPIGEGLAYRYYNEKTLEDLLGPNRYHPYYDDYRYCLLLEQGGNLTIANPIDATDLTPLGSESTVLLQPVRTEELRMHFGYDVNLLLSDGTPFDKPICLKKGEIIHIQLTRPGYNIISIPLNINPDSKRMTFPLYSIKPTALNWQIPLMLKDIDVIDEDGRSIKDGEDGLNLRVKVNNQFELKPGLTHWIDEKDGHNVIIEVYTNSLKYQNATVKADLTQKPLSVKLKYQRKNKSAIVIDSNGEEATLSYEMKVMDKDSTPLKGYIFNSRGELQYDTLRSWILRLQGFCFTLVLALVCWLGYSLVTDQLKNKVENKQLLSKELHDGLGTPDTCSPPQKSTTTESTSLNEQPKADVLPQTGVQIHSTDIDNQDFNQAIAYLEGNKVWKRSEMETYKSLQGLFDDMNEFKLDKLISSWSQELQLSTRFQKVVTVAQKNMSHKWNPATGQHTPYFNKPGDEVIKVINYIYWLDRDQTKPIPQQPKQEEKAPQTNIKGKANQTTKPITPTKKQVGSKNKKYD